MNMNIEDQIGCLYSSRVSLIQENIPLGDITISQIGIHVFSLVFHSLSNNVAVISRELAEDTLFSTLNEYEY
jgi:hypothetical protein